MADHVEQLEALRAAGQAVVDAEAARQAAARKAVEAGVPITVVARELGLSRPTIYKIIAPVEAAKRLRD